MMPRHGATLGIVSGLGTLVVASSACDQPFSAETLTLTGVVTFEDAPAAGWKVYVEKLAIENDYSVPVLVDSTTTGLDGRYRIFTDACENTWLYAVPGDAGSMGAAILFPEKGDYDSRDLCGGSSSFDFAFERARSRIDGTAVSWSEPLVGAKVTVKGEEARDLIVDEDGRFIADSLPWGDYTVTISDYGSDVVIDVPQLRATVADGTTFVLFQGRPDPPPIFTAIRAAPGHSCGITSTASAYCWGDPSLGVMGSPIWPVEDMPVEIRGGHAFVDLALGTDLSCGLTAAGEAWCWGRELGRWDAQLLTGGPWVSLSAGDRHACGLTAGSEVYCWGGEGPDWPPTWHDPEPVGAGVSWAAVDAGGDAACGVTTDGEGYCWSWYADSVPALDPQPVPGGHTWVSLTGNGSHFCGIVGGGDAYCWGDGGDGQLGSRTWMNEPEPVRVAGGLQWAALTVAGSFNSYDRGRHTCGVTTDARAYCWGWNLNGQLGDGSTINRTAPAAVAGTSLEWAYVDAGYDHTCGATQAGDLYCWGSNDYGQLGDSTRVDSAVPVRVGQRW